MPFGLKNAGATDQRAIKTILDDMLHKIVDNSKRRSDHLQDLHRISNRLKRCQLKMNPLKYAFGITSGKFLGFIVRGTGIEID